MQTIKLTKGDTAPVVFKNWKDADGADILTSAVATVTINLKQREAPGASIQLASCPITSSGATPLVCEWRPLATDLNFPGTYDVELVLTFATGKVKRLPGQLGDIVFLVRNSLA